MGKGYGQFATADLNGDGLTDVVGTDAALNLVSALGRGDGTFSSTYTTAGSSLANVATGDFNGDGKIDVVASSWGALGEAVDISGPQDSHFISMRETAMAPFSQAFLE